VEGLTIVCATVDAVVGVLIVRLAVRLTPFSAVEMISVPSVALLPTITENVFLVLPPGKVMLAGTVARLVSLLESRTVMPVAGAGDVSVTVPVTMLPLATVAAPRVTLLRVACVGGCCRERVTDLVTFARVASRAMVVAAGTADAEKVTAALVLPAGTVTEVGNVTSVEALRSETTTPPRGAGWFNVTVKVPIPAPDKLAGLTERADKAGAVTAVVGQAGHIVFAQAEAFAMSTPASRKVSMADQVRAPNFPLGEGGW
jgi:hypothetical protein